MSYSDDLAAFINAVVEEKAKELQARKSGRPVPGGMGSSLGGVTGESDGIDGGEDGDDSNEGMEKLTDRLKPGDKPEKFKLFDCDTSEEVTLDGIGGNGAKPAYPTGFEDCKNPQLPPDYTKGQYWSLTYQKHYDGGRIESGTLYYHSKSLDLEGAAGVAGKYAECAVDGLDANGVVVCAGTGDYFQFNANMAVNFCSSNYNPICDTDPTVSWPAVDKNHLVWNEDKECFEPLCAELNTQVSAEYSSCNDEMILCDEDGNKVKVEIDGDEMKVTQAKFNQEAIIKNGKVQSTKPLTPEQIARAFK